MNSYYSDTLYPLQNKVLRIIEAAKSHFYLTGGTALSRGYYHHRYSDDLDLFVNKDPDFQPMSEKIISALQAQFKIDIRIKSESFYGLNIESILKLDMINDVGFHSGDFLNTPLFNHLDNITNILSNKITALQSRDEPKDVVDIWMISTHEAVNWPAIFQDANSKAVGIFPPEIAKRLTEFPLELLSVIKWEQSAPDQKKFTSDITNICDQMLQLK